MGFLDDLNDKSSIGLRRNLRQNMTDAERVVWNIVRNKQLDGYKFFRQYSVGHYILDFYCPVIRLAIEIDDGQHNYAPERLRDKQRTEYLKSLDIRVLRFWNNEVLENQDGVYEEIARFITPPNLPLP
ncbi:MAG: DUF559 domain-containing protein [Candidatus Doudnabacteria bacterium]|nr:DUF559 domain-containing protein [Candidatus Doudnabacteria bacterium]